MKKIKKFIINQTTIISFLLMICSFSFLTIAFFVKETYSLVKENNIQTKLENKERDDKIDNNDKRIVVLETYKKIKDKI